MEWWLILIIIFGSFLLFMLSGLPVALCFWAMNILGVLFFMSGKGTYSVLILTMFESVRSLSLGAVPLFLLMGEVMFISGIAPRMMDALDQVLGRMPGRLALLAVVGGVVFAVMSGSGAASVAMLGSVLVPEMEKRGYKKAMTLGPIMGSGGLAVMIPPSAMCVLFASLANVSVGKLLVANTLPGFVLASIFAIYIITRSCLQPSIAPRYAIPPTTLSKKIGDLAIYVLPLGGIVFLVIGLIMLGVATPSEAAALGALGCFVLAFIYRRLNWEMVKKSVAGTFRVSGMLFLIYTGATGYSQLLAYTGSSAKLIETVVASHLPSLSLLIFLMLIIVLLGMFMEGMTIAMITLPIFMPIARKLGFDPIWFSTIMLITVELAAISPPFGMSLFVMKSVAPPDTTMGDVYQASIPFIGLKVLLIALIIIFPPLSLWLPGIMTAG